MKEVQFKLPKKPKLIKIESRTSQKEALPPPPWVYPIGWPDSNFQWTFTPFPLAFSLMPSRASSDIRLSRNDLRVLGALCCYTSPKGICFPNQSTLANHLGIQRPSVTKAISRLKSFGYIRSLAPKGKKHKSAIKRGNRYQVLVRGNELIPEKEMLVAE